MRKFKFMSKAVVGMMAVAMTMGSLSGVAFSQPTAIYAAAGNYTVTASPAEVTAGQESTVTLSATLEDESGNQNPAEDLTFTLKEAYEGVTIDGATMTIAATAAAGTVTISVAKTGDDTVTIPDFTFTIRAADESGDDNTGEYSMEAFVDARPMTLTVQTNDPYFTVDVLKTASDTEKPSKSYTYANNTDKSVVIDLGFLKVKKGNILNVYGSSVTDKSKGNIVTVEAQPAKEKITVDATKASLAEAIGKSEADAKKYEYASSFRGDWHDLEFLDFEAAKVAGTTIIVRLKAEDVAAEGTTAAKSTPAGPEVKVKIPAAPKAPKVTVDYVKGTVKVTDKMQIAILPENGPVKEADWKTAKKGMTRKELAKELLGEETSTAEFKMVVRTAAAGKKSASMPVIVAIKDQPVLGYVDAEKKDSVTVKIGDTTSTLKAVRDKDGGLTFTATGSFEYEDGGKWKKITSGKTIKSFGSDKVNVRLAGAKADKNTPNSGSFASTESELEVPKPADSTTGGDTTTATVESVTISVKNGATDLTSGDTTEVEIGTELTISATVTGTGNPAQTVTWKVTKTDADAASQVADGKLTIDAGDTAGTVLTITATSTVDSTKSATFTIKTK